MSYRAVTDIIMIFSILSSEDIALELASRVKNYRLAQRLTQEGLSSRSGVPFGTLKKFEHTGQIALISFIRLVTALGDEAALENLLLEQKYETLEEVLDVKKKPKRGVIK
jgi:transcriptional regulator with XRE-family HTH domain